MQKSSYKLITFQVGIIIISPIIIALANQKKTGFRDINLFLDSLIHSFNSFVLYFFYIPSFFKSIIVLKLSFLFNDLSGTR